MILGKAIIDVIDLMLIKINDLYLIYHKSKEIVNRE